jgi:hypothetical protein
MSNPFLRMSFDFHLASAGSAKARQTIAASDAVA